MTHNINTDKICGMGIQVGQKTLYLTGGSTEENQRILVQGVFHSWKRIGQIALNILTSPKLGKLPVASRTLMAGEPLIVETDPEDDASLTKNILGKNRESSTRCAFGKNVGIIRLHHIANLRTLYLDDRVSNRTNPLAAIAAYASICIDAGIRKPLLVGIHDYTAHRTC